MVMGRRGTEELKLRFYPGQHDDIIAWLRQFDGKPHGAKSQQAIDALRRGIGTNTAVGQSAAATASALDRSAEISRHSLAELRQVVEAAVDTALGRFEGQINGGTRAAAQEEDDETEALLDDLEAALVLEDDA
jgi:hypothetical protein